MATDTATHDAEGAEVSFGLQKNLAGALAYFTVFGIILLVVEEESDFVRFHAAQSVVLGLGLFAVRLSLSIFGSILATLPVIGSLIGLVSMLVSLAGVVLILFAAYKAYSGAKFEVPVVAGVAKGIA